MHDFWIKIVSVIMVCSILLEYNMVVDGREKEEEIGRLNAQMSDSQSQGKDGTYSYKDGAYTAEAQGFGGPVAIELVVKQAKIEQITVLSAEKEDGAYLSMAQEIIPQILEAQNADVDIISGATFSSTAIREACAKAIEEAGQ